MRKTNDLIREAILAKNKKKAQISGGDNASYPFWNIPEDSTATVRYLPDADPDNVFFWREKLTIKMPFAGIVGSEDNTDREVTVNVPCVEQFGLTCPVIAATKPWWKDPTKESLARQYWKKRSYIFQGFVVNSPFDEKEVPANPIRRFVVNPSIYEIIERSLVSTDMEDSVVDYVGGRDFKIAKTRRGDYANYGTSSWNFKSRALSETELAAIDQHGLFDLKEYLGSQPDSDGIEAIKAMFEASIAGEPYDMAAFGTYYKPYGLRSGGGDIAAAVQNKVAETRAPARGPENEDADEPRSVGPSAGKSSPQDILDRVRSRIKT
jgi:hypothetical protein